MALLKAVKSNQHVLVAKALNETYKAGMGGEINSIANANNFYSAAQTPKSQMKQNA